MVALLLWVVAGTALAVVAVAEQAVDRARAQAAADAVALAAAVEPASAAIVAMSNGATIVDEIRAGPEVYVEVRVGDIHERAQAAVPRPAWSGLTEPMQQALARAEASLGYEIPIVSGFRSRSDQERLWAARDTNPYPVAAPGTSAHERGVAVDVPRDVAPALARVGGLAGLCRPLPILDPVHFVLCRTTPTR